MNKKGLVGELIMLVVAIILLAPFLIIVGANFISLTGVELPMNVRLDLAIRKPIIVFKGEILHNLFGNSIAMFGLLVGRAAGTVPSTVRGINSALGLLTEVPAYTVKYDFKNPHEFAQWVAQHSSACWDLLGNGGKSIPLYTMKNPATCYYAEYDFTQEITLKYLAKEVDYGGQVEYSRIRDGETLYESMEKDLYGEAGLLDYIFQYQNYWKNIVGGEGMLEGQTYFSDYKTYEDCGIIAGEETWDENPLLCYYNDKKTLVKTIPIQCQEDYTPGKGEIMKCYNQHNATGKQTYSYALDTEEKGKRTIMITNPAGEAVGYVSEDLYFGGAAVNAKKPVLLIKDPAEWDAIIRNLATGRPYIIDYYYGARYPGKEDWEGAVHLMGHENLLVGDETAYYPRDWIKPVPCTYFAIYQDSKVKISPVCWKNIETLNDALNYEEKEPYFSKGTIKGGYKDISGRGDAATWTDCNGGKELAGNTESAKLGGYSTSILKITYDRMMICIENENDPAWETKTITSNTFKNYEGEYDYEEYKDNDNECGPDAD